MLDVDQHATTARLWSPGDELGGAWLDAINSRIDRAVPVAERLLESAIERDDATMAVRAKHVLALAFLGGGRWRLAEPYIDGILDQLDSDTDPAFAAHAWVMRAACHAEREQPDSAFESLVRAEMAAESVAEPSDQLALAFGDMAVILSEMALYEYAERMLTRAVAAAIAAGAPIAMYLFKQGRNLARWAMRLEHLGSIELAIDRYRAAVTALQVARDAEPDPRFSLENWMMTSVATLCRGRASLLSGERWRPPKAEMASYRWMIKSSHSPEDAQWRVHAAASVALVTGEPRHALALLDGLNERDYAVLGPRLPERWHLYVLAYERVSDAESALRAHRKMHTWYDEDSYRNRRSRVEVARSVVQELAKNADPVPEIVAGIGNAAEAEELAAAWLDAVNSRTSLAVVRAGRLLGMAVQRADDYLAMRAEHVFALAYVCDGQWTQAEPHIARMFEHLTRSPEPAYAAHAWALHAACCAERGDADDALESLIRAELAAESASTPSDQLAHALSDMAMILSEMAQYELAEQTLVKAVETATAAAAPLRRHLFKRVANLTKWAMRLEHLGRTDEAVQRYQESVQTIAVARAAEPDPRFGLESWVMCSLNTLCRARAAFLRGQSWRPTEPQEAAPDWKVESDNAFEDVLWRAHAAASVALANNEPADALTTLDAFDEEQYDVIGPRLADRCYLYLLAHEQMGHHREALVASRNLHDFYDGDAYRSRRQRAEAARERVARALRDGSRVPGQRKGVGQLGNPVLVV